MKNIGCLVVISLLVATGYGQTFTMGKKCREAYQVAQSALNSKSYQEALTLFEQFSDKCKTKDAKELGSVGKAEAYNGLGAYEEAIAEAEKALDVTKQQSLNGWFQKGMAQHNLGNVEGSKESLEQVMKLTEMNQNTEQRASNYALMAALYSRQMNKPDSALVYLDKARAMDPNNPDFFIQEGDIYMNYNQFENAFAAYDQAQAAGKNDMEMYIIRSESGLKMMEHKYGTLQARELKSKMTSEEKQNLCKDIKTALDMGWRDMNKDMFAALVCN